ncbi:MAG: helix-turn-helix domain-containing protein [Otoolea sp.]
MNHYLTGATIRTLREQKHITQAELANQIGVSDKTISKWETGRGLPDITLIEPLAKALQISVMELLTGDYVTNRNISANMLRSRFYVCPVCGNVIHTIGEAVVSCCGITLPVLEAEEENREKPSDTKEESLLRHPTPEDPSHHIHIERVEDEYYVTVSHEMTREHYISFLAYVTSDQFQMIRLYPEGNAETRLLLRGHGYLYAFCNRHGLFRQKV